MGCLPAKWEDFICEDKRYPHFAITTIENANDPHEIVEPESGEHPDADGWFSCRVDAPQVDAANAREIIARKLGIDPSVIQIKQDGRIVSV